VSRHAPTHYIPGKSTSDDFVTSGGSSPEKGETEVVYNWDTAPRDVTVRLADLRLPVNVSPAQPKAEPAVPGNGTITITAQPGESLRIVHLNAIRKSE
jgi:hypothetical protein